jgi:hypothetical protein
MTAPSKTQISFRDRKNYLSLWQNRPVLKIVILRERRDRRIYILRFAQDDKKTIFSRTSTVFIIPETGSETLSESQDDAPMTCAMSCTCARKAGFRTSTRARLRPAPARRARTVISNPTG